MLHKLTHVLIKSLRYFELFSAVAVQECDGETTPGKYKQKVLSQNRED